jgi:hypothetical protein
MKIDLTPSQREEARVTSDKVARIMEEKPTCIRPEMTVLEAGLGKLSPKEWWVWKYGATDWTPNFALNGYVEDADAYACHLMKARLIELTLYIDIDYRQAAPEYDLVQVDIQARCFPGKTHSESAPLEVLAVAQALIAVDEERRKGGK